MIFKPVLRVKHLVPRKSERRLMQGSCEPSKVVELQKEIFRA